MIHVCACGKEFTNKSNFNRHTKKCQAVSVDSVSFNSVVYEKESVEPEPNTNMTEVKLPDVVEIDSAIASAHAHAQHDVPSPLLTKNLLKIIHNNANNTGLEPVPDDNESPIDIMKVPLNTELCVSFSLPEHSRVYLDRFDDQNPEHVWIKIDNFSIGRRMQKIHVSQIIMAMVEES